jgi:hypothetical protein
MFLLICIFATLAVSNFIDAYLWRIIGCRSRYYGLGMMYPPPPVNYRQHVQDTLMKMRQG